MAELYRGYPCEEFDFERTGGIVVFPDGNSNGKIAFKTEYWDAFPEMQMELLKVGFHLVHLKNKTRLANREDCDRKARFIEFVSEKYGLDKRCVLIGMSCGGAQAINFGAYYPQYTEMLVIDAPVVNFLDFPGRYNAYEEIWEKEFKPAYPDVKRSDLFALPENPINNVSALIKEGFPVIMIYGNSDQTVIYEHNGRLLEEAYSDTPALLTVIKRAEQGHHPHGLLQESYKIADMVLEKIKQK